MLTRARAKAENRPVLVDLANDSWTDSYIESKDEVVEAMHARDPALSWDHLREEGSDASDSEESDASDAWDSDASDSEDDEGDAYDDDVDRSAVKRWVAGGSWLQNVLWSVATLTFVPLATYMVLVRPNTPRHPLLPPPRWPLESATLAGLLVKVFLNVMTLAGLFSAIYGAFCLADPLDASKWLFWRRLNIAAPEECSVHALNGWSVCVKTLSTSFGSWEQLESTVRNLPPLCVDALRQLAIVATAVTLIVGVFHRAWAKLLVVTVTLGYVALNVTSEVQRQQRAAVTITSLDPQFAFANESIFIAIDGQNLEQGGTIAWAPYWGGLQQRHAADCPKLFPQQLRHGGVLVTFDQVNEYVPCYQSAAANSASIVAGNEIRPAAALQCFDAIRLRVKDQKSVPGWSLSARDAASADAESKDEL